MRLSLVLGERQSLLDAAVTLDVDPGLAGYEDAEVVQAVVPAVPHHLLQAALLGGEEDRVGQVVLLLVHVEPLGQLLSSLVPVVLDPDLPQEEIIIASNLRFEKF